MEKEDFIKILQRSSPNEVREFIERKGKRKLIDPFIWDNISEGENTNEYSGKS